MVLLSQLQTIITEITKKQQESREGECILKTEDRRDDVVKKIDD